MIGAVIAFSLAALLVTITPGLDTALVLRSAMAHGSRSALLAALGICVGCLCWGIAAAVGLGVLVSASTVAYMALKFVGAAYLAYLGVLMLTATRHEIVTSAEPELGSGSFQRGLLTNLLNPKVGLFYVAFLPQFIPAGADVLMTTILFAAIHAALGIAWLASLILLIRPVAESLRKPSVLRWLDRVVGSLFLAFAARLVLSRD